MIKYSSHPLKTFEVAGKQINSFVDNTSLNKVINSFGNEWSKFNQFSKEDLFSAGQEYFDIVNNTHLNESTYVLDAGCGTARWSYYLADKVGFIEVVDPSNAVISAASVTRDLPNIRISQANIEHLPFPDESFDFILCLGVLHHIPDTENAVKELFKKLKPGGFLLGYMYYNFENRGIFFKSIFKLATILRFVIARLPGRLKNIVCDTLAILTYLPFIYVSKLIKVLFPKKNWYSKIPLSNYINKSFYIIRNDALDRFGTRLEKRYSKQEITALLKRAGFSQITFSNNEPYWHFITQKPVL